MGHKVNAVGFRVGVFRNWFASWFANKPSKSSVVSTKETGYNSARKLFARNLKEDFTIRKFILSQLPKFSVDDIFIERAGDLVKIVLNAVNPGVIIGKKGGGIDTVVSSLKKMLGKRIDFSVKDVRNPDVSAKSVANSIAEQIEKRVNFKKAMKRAGFLATKAGAKGIKICASGRLGGAEIARVEWLRQGSVPLHTIRANVDYALAEAKTVYGMIGVRVWICNGEF